ncbi:Metallo-dependent phosphatase [Ramicandelaber brevisporus]|nr:Metallo-dependent phosphatase [Ramicandelaber brevisporus]
MSSVQAAYSNGTGPHSSPASFTPAAAAATRTIPKPVYTSGIERQVPSVRPLERRVPLDSEVFPNGLHNPPNYIFLSQHFHAEGRLTLNQALAIVEQGTRLLSSEPTLLELYSYPTTNPRATNGADFQQRPGLASKRVAIVGDIHGQYYDLLKIFRVGGDLNSTTYLFMGDYVDRGMFAVECVLLLWAIKLSHPKSFFMLRGNHESRAMTSYFTYKKECLYKYGEQFYEACLKSFDTLPLAAVVDGKYFCVHGGLSPQLVTLDDVRQLNRFHEPPHSGLLCDLLWSDPLQHYDLDQSQRTFVENNTRGCSYYFTFNAVRAFLQRNQLTMLIRAHEAQQYGYSVGRDRSMVTIFSAPNYLDTHGNYGAVIVVEKELFNIQTFKHVEHPFVLSDFRNAFTMSMPFVNMCALSMLAGILDVCSNEELESPDEEEDGDIAIDGIANDMRLMHPYGDALPQSAPAVPCAPAPPPQLTRTGTDESSSSLSFMRKSRPPAPIIPLPSSISAPIASYFMPNAPIAASAAAAPPPPPPPSAPPQLPRIESLADAGRQVRKLREIANQFGLLAQQCRQKVEEPDISKMLGNLTLSTSFDQSSQSGLSGTRSRNNMSSDQELSERDQAVLEELQLLVATVRQLNERLERLNTMTAPDGALDKARKAGIEEAERCLERLMQIPAIASAIAAAAATAQQQQ